MLNLTRAMAVAVAELKRLRQFNGLYLIEARTQSEEQKREDCASDELSAEETESNINDYVCCGFHFDTYDCAETNSRYATVEFDHSKLEKDFKAWLLPYLDGDESVFPKHLNLEGGDNEFMKPGYGDKE